MGRFNRPVLVALAVVMGLAAAPPADAAVGTVAGTLALVGSIKVMLEDLMRTASDEVRLVLQEAMAEIAALESLLMTDLRDFEDVLLADLESLVGVSLSQADSMLQGLLARLTHLSGAIDEMVARQVSDAVHQANLTWDRVARDAEHLLVRLERGVAVVVDTSSVQVLRVVALVAAAVLLVTGVLVLRKWRLPGSVSVGIGLVLGVFCLTPWFYRATSNWGALSAELATDKSIGPPEVLLVRPAASFDFRQDGEVQLLGLNLLPQEGGSRLVVGRTEDSMSVVPAAAISSARITIPMRVFTEQSGTYHFAVQRDDGKSTPRHTVYVNRPVEIPIHIDYTIWQTGTFRSLMTGSYSIRKTQDDHGSGKTSREYTYRYTPPTPWRSSAFTKSVLSINNASDLSENLAGTGLQVKFTLTSGPWWNRWRGWYRADYSITNEQTGSGNTRELATHGEKTLYLNQEDGSITGRQSNLYAPSLGRQAYELQIGGAVVSAVDGAVTRPAVGALSDALKRTFLGPADTVLDMSASLEMVPPLAVDEARFFRALTGGNSIMSALRDRAVVRSPEGRLDASSPGPAASARPGVQPSAGPPGIESLPAAIRALPQESRFRFQPPARQQFMEFELGAAPVVPGFTPAQTWYDIIVTWPDHQFVGMARTGTSAITDRSGSVVMRARVQGGTLYVKWLHGAN